MSERFDIETCDDIFWYRPRLSSTSFDKPLEDSQTVIRYLTAPKFTRMVRASAVHFCRLDLLRHCDELEGSVAPYNLALDRAVQWRYGESEKAQRQLQRQQYEQVWLSQAYVACFSLDDDENPYHYSTYLKARANLVDGVAVFSTVGALRSMCTNDPGDGGAKDAVIAPIEYIDFAKDAMIEREFDFPAFYKDNRWQSDRELRFMVRYRLGMLHGQNGVYGERWPTGEYRPIDLNKFITSIKIAPHSRRRYYDSVIALLERNRVNIPTMWSTLPWFDRDE